MDVTRIIRIIIGVGMCLFGFVGVAFGVIAMIDPVGSKLSDDNDPLGPPPPFVESLVITLVYLTIAGAGAFLAAYKDKSGNSN